MRRRGSQLLRDPRAHVPGRGLRGPHGPRRRGRPREGAQPAAGPRDPRGAAPEAGRLRRARGAAGLPAGAPRRPRPAAHGLLDDPGLPEPGAEARRRRHREQARTPRSAARPRGGEAREREARAGGRGPEAGGTRPGSPRRRPRAPRAAAGPLGLAARGAVPRAAPPPPRAARLRRDPPRVRKEEEEGPGRGWAPRLGEVQSGERDPRPPARRFGTHQPRRDARVAAAREARRGPPGPDPRGDAHARRGGPRPRAAHPGGGEAARALRAGATAASASTGACASRAATCSA